MIRIRVQHIRETNGRDLGLLFPFQQVMASRNAGENLLQSFGRVIFQYYVNQNLKCTCPFLITLHFKESSL